MNKQTARSSPLQKADDPSAEGTIYVKGRTARRRIEKARFLDRLNRFTVRCASGSEILDAYLPNPGRLWELLLPGCTLFIARQETGANRKLPGLVMAVERDGRPVMLHTLEGNDVVADLLKRQRLPGFEEMRIVQREITQGRSRYDFLLEEKGKPSLLEVKSCTLFGRRIAMFPDAVTLRGRRHLTELSELSRRGMPAHVLFLVHWSGAEFFLPDYHTDFEFASTFLAVRNDIRFHAVAVDWQPDMSLGPEVRELRIPWTLLEREVQDGGICLLILCLPEDMKVDFGNSDPQVFRKGYYIALESSRSQLSRRLQILREEGKRKGRSGSVLEALRDAAVTRLVIPIRAVEPLESEMADALARICDWSLPELGNDRDSGPVPIFGMREPPLQRRAFVDLLMDFRINRLEKWLP